jgi:hypothetical protein
MEIESLNNKFQDAQLHINNARGMYVIDEAETGFRCVLFC